MLTRSRGRQGELCSQSCRFVRLGPNRHCDPAILIERFVENFGMAMKPADARAVCRVEADLNDFSTGGKSRFD
jgi:hypothetical protein